MLIVNKLLSPKKVKYLRCVCNLRNSICKPTSRCQQIQLGTLHLSRTSVQIVVIPRSSDVAPEHFGMTVSHESYGQFVLTCNLYLPLGKSVTVSAKNTAPHIVTVIYERSPRMPYFRSKILVHKTRKLDQPRTSFIKFLIT